MATAFLNTTTGMVYARGISGALTLTGTGTQILNVDGTASLPAYSYASEAGLGVFRAANNALGFAWGTAERFRMDATGGFTSSLPISWGANPGSPDISLSRGAANRLDLASGDSFYLVNGGLGVGSAPGASGITTAGAIFAATTVTATTALQLGASAGSATSTYKLVKKVTAIADNSATAVITVTVPNANHAATIRLTLLSSNGSTDAFESSRTADGAIVLTRTTGVATVAVAATLTLTGIATVAAGATHTLAYGVTAMSGAVGATQTFSITVTIDDSGNLGSNQCVVMAELINAEATGVTIA